MFTECGLEKFQTAEMKILTVLINN